MLKAITRRLLHRTSSRLSLIFILVSVLIGLVAIFSLRGILPEHPRNQLSQLLAQHVVEPLGAHPTPHAVRDLASDLGIGILVQDGNRAIRAGAIRLSDASVQELMDTHRDRISYDLSYNGDRLFVLRYDGLFYVFSDFVVGMSPGARAKMLGGPMVIFLILLTGFWAVRRTVSPLAPLTEAVRAIGEGNLERRVKPIGWGEIRGLEMRVNDMAAALSRADRRKRDILIAIGHEFFSPIARLMFQAERIKDKQLRDKITENLLRINLLFRTLLSVETLENEANQNSGQALLFPDCIVEIATAAGKDMVTFQLPERQCYVYINRIRLELVLNNLISNAIRYAPDSAIEISASHGKDTLTLIVADRGPGVSDEFIDDLFEPFVREDKARGFLAEGGLGLGLYICGCIVGRAGGKLQGRNREGGGLEIRVDWPCLAQVLP